MIEHVMAVLRDETENQIGPGTPLDALRLTLDIEQRVNRPH
ncbi:hypothetical protein AB0M57_24095 [Streptomyces sp. NPDC051597]